MLSAPLTRWMMHSKRSPIPAHLRKPDVAEAAWKQCAFTDTPYFSAYPCGAVHAVHCTQSGQARP